jgi:hypothetical protein
MTDSAYEFLTDFFVNYLPFTPTPKQIALFQVDLALVSPFLMEAALREVKAGTAGTLLTHTPNQWRPEIFKIYNRKVAEQAQLFPVFHSFETAFRSTVAVNLERHYKHPRWWVGINNAVLGGKPPHTVTQVSGVTVTRDAADAIGRVVESLNAGPNPPDAFNNGYEFVECCDLGHIGQLIQYHWPVFSPLFVQGGNRLTAHTFRKKFNRVRNARNDIYHHKSVARLKKVVSTAEELLDYLNFSLAFVCTKVKDVKLEDIKFRIQPTTRHNIWS